ncbi:phenylalanyl-tRNA synthetase subunit alpha [Devosia chinhatensis]|uniref:Phenylalanine--tRNA ligase alpha subunit n=2 Tax=Devosia chinhatensis TaxID=429727 RepID=A0A0F5FI35_9HYPH|nr:phenylalanine--tRNA ligase subunit alpha [Devosia chinhatensis]KKB07877.1 phenylalanyl-tRNA synthetase subunit alpha [Devosia chinhatensis]
MMSLDAQISALRSDLTAAIAAAENEAGLDAVRVAALGKKGSVSALLATLGSMPPEERKAAGPAINGLKTEIAGLIEARGADLKAAALDARLAAETLDVTLPLRPAPTARGRIHPISQTIDEITAIFSDMGFSIAEGPDIETDYYNFTALNFPEGHPAREMHDTFFMKPGPDGIKKVLRTHTSPVQVRVMQKTNEKPAASYLTPPQDPPIRVVMPGRTYRNDSDQTHTPMFHQVEGLVIDKSSHIGQLRWVLEEFLKAFFEVPSVTLRFRPSFFPFTEPSMEVDVQCDRSGAEVKIGEGNDWLEILGCGMVHPNVIRSAGLDPDVYQGFAWGIGIDRIAMLKYGMPDLRDFFDADQRWIEHYGFRPLDLPTLFGGLSS